MIIKSWRLVKENFLQTAFNGEGARRYGGRWNNKGIPIIYTAGSLALAAMELLVHLESYAVLNAYYSIPVEFDSSLLLKLNPRDLPDNWNEDPPPASTKDIGDKWYNLQSSVVLNVPSTIIKEENNYLINPHHPDFKKLNIGKPSLFKYNPRLIKKK